MYEMRGYIGVMKDGSEIMLPLNTGFLVKSWEDIDPFMKKNRIQHYIITLDKVSDKEE